jgi:hypothetical protein
MGDIDENSELVSEEEQKAAKDVINSWKTQPLRGYSFGLKTDQFLRAHNDVLFLRALFRNLDWLLLKDIDYSILDDSNIVVICFGLKRVGKSSILGGLATHIQNREINLGRHLDPKIYISFSNDETTAIIRHKAKSGDIIWQDEIIDQSGEDSAIQKRQIFNLQENLAAKHIHFLFASNKLKGFEEISNFVLLPSKKDRENKLNECIIFFKFDIDQRLLPLGRVSIPLTTNEELEKEYNVRKKAYVDSLAETGGFSMVRIDKTRAKMDIDKVLNLMEEELQGIPENNWKKAWIHGFVRDCDIVGSGKYLSYIESKIDIHIQRKLALLQSSLNNNQEEEEDFLAKKPRDFYKYLKNSIEIALVKNKIFPSLEKARIYSTYFFSGVRFTWEEVAEELKTEELADSLRKYVSNRKNKSKALVAKTFELVIADWLNEKIFDTSSSPDLSAHFQTLGGPKMCDIVLGSCPSNHLLSINAKVNLGDRSSYQHPISPEFKHCETNCFVFEWTKNHGLYIQKVSQKNFKRSSGEELSLDQFIEYCKEVIQ